jgi:hypothetical protein
MHTQAQLFGFLFRFSPLFSFSFFFFFSPLTGCDLRELGRIYDMHVSSSAYDMYVSSSSYDCDLRELGRSV